MVVSQEEFKRISMLEICKEAWDILEIIHEGTKIVKNSKLQMLTTNFEELRMKDDETFDSFYAKLNDIVNSRFSLGDKLPKNRIVRKVLKFLPERFRLKVTTIEESKDLDTMRIEELVGSLQTYEYTLLVDKKNKFITLNTIRDELDESSNEFVMSSKEITFYAKKFRKMFVTRNNKNQDKRIRNLKDTTKTRVLGTMRGALRKTLVLTKTRCNQRYSVMHVMDLDTFT